jgi:hypothetical protein
MFKGGFPKKKLESTKTKYIKIFLYEIRRAELTHWLIILSVPIFFSGICGGLE